MTELVPGGDRGPISNPRTCMTLANMGKGKVYRVKDYYEVPRAIYNLLREFA